MIPLAGPPLASFLVFEEIFAFRHLVPARTPLLLALVGLLLVLLLEGIRPRS